ncbi:MAG: molybdopterin molybdotransferase MoeA, partial [Pseudomonadota bacterium]
QRDQPPFAASAMDGYAVAGTVKPGDRLRVIGQSAAGHRFSKTVAPGEAVRIFTGAPLPKSADRVILQEDAEVEGDHIILRDRLDASPFVRPAAGDFGKGAELAPCWLGPAEISLAAAMGHARLRVGRHPDVAIITTGDELCVPGGTPRDDQIFSSNAYGLHALLSSAGARVRLLPIAADTEEALISAFRFAKGADLIVSIGGASVGDHDLIRRVTRKLGLEESFYRVAVRPGKPLIAGRLGSASFVALPGNPVSALVCGQVFLIPMMRALQGDTSPEPTPKEAALTHGLGPNGPRTHYMRARLENGKLTIAEHQDSSLLSVLRDANALAIRTPNDGQREEGECLPFVLLTT